MRVKKEVAQLVKFQRLNLMDAQWPIEGIFDVIFFRNALIYFNSRNPGGVSAQDAALPEAAELSHSWPLGACALAE